MKTMHSVMIGGLMAMSLAACSSTGGDTTMSSGSSAGGATAGGSNNATNTAVPVTPPTLDGANPPPNVPSATASNGVDNGPGSR